MLANLQYGWTLFVNPMQDAESLELDLDPGGVHHSDFREHMAVSLRGLAGGSLRAASGLG